PDSPWGGRRGRSEARAVAASIRREGLGPGRLGLLARRGGRARLPAREARLSPGGRARQGAPARARPAGPDHGGRPPRRGETAQAGEDQEPVGRLRGQVSSAGLPVIPTAPSRAPEWIRERKLRLSELHGVKSLMRAHGLHTVCEEARCPNRGECFSRGPAPCLLLGAVCTRACGFCDIKTGRPLPVDPLEPRRVRDAVAALRLRFVVLTSVDRDDLPDGGAGHFAAAIRAVRSLEPAPGV